MHPIKCSTKATTIYNCLQQVKWRIILIIDKFKSFANCRALCYTLNIETGISVSQEIRNGTFTVGKFSFKSIAATFNKMNCHINFNMIF